MWSIFVRRRHEDVMDMMIITIKSRIISTVDENPLTRLQSRSRSRVCRHQMRQELTQTAKETGAKLKSAQAVDHTDGASVSEP